MEDKKNEKERERIKAKEGKYTTEKENKDAKSNRKTKNK